MTKGITPEALFFLFLKERKALGFKERKYKKGITPVIATILLLLITISMVGFAFVFFQRTTQTAARSGEEQLNQTTGQITTLFSIDGVDKNMVYSEANN